MLLSQVQQQGAGATGEQLQLEREHTWDVDITDGCLLFKLSLFTQQKLQAPHSQLRMHQLWLQTISPKLSLSHYDVIYNKIPMVNTPIPTVYLTCKISKKSAGQVLPPTLPF